MWLSLVIRRIIGVYVGINNILSLVFGFGVGVFYDWEVELEVLWLYTRGATVDELKAYMSFGWA